MTRSLLTKTELERAALLDIRTRFGCSLVSGVEVEFVFQLGSDVNWRIASIGRGAPSDPMDLINDRYAIQATEAKLRRIFNLKLS